jgi:hypothetical protein
MSVSRLNLRTDDRRKSRGTLAAWISGTSPSGQNGEFLTVFKIILKLFAATFILSCIFIAAAPHTLAASTPTVSLSNASNLLVGHVGTPITLKGQDFPANSTVSLFLATSSDASQCTAANAANLLPFKTQPQITASASGAFQKNTTWPDNASNATTTYWLCAIAGADAVAMSAADNGFTVAQPAKIDSIEPATIAPGGKVTVKGSGWLPIQKLTVSVSQSPSTQAVVFTSVNSSDREGIFTAQLSVPANVLPGNYLVIVTANNEKTAAMTTTGALTIQAQATVTPSPTATATVGSTPTATATVAPQPTPDTGSNNTNSGSGLATWLILLLGGVGVILVVVGITMLVIYSRKP